MTARGLWVDCAPADVVKPGWWSEYRRLGLTEAALMAERSGPDFDARYTDEQLRTVGQLARDVDVELGLTIWPEPDVGYLAELERRIPTMLAASGAAFLDLDAESNWSRKRIRGFDSLEDAGDALLGMLAGVLRGLDVRLEVDTFPGHAENGPSALLSPRAHRRFPQAYSVRQRDRAGVPFFVEWEDALGPGRIQRSAMARSASMGGDGVVCCGLAAYDQTWPGRRPHDAMRVAYDAAVAGGAPSVRWWSSRWVVGRSATPYGARFLEELVEEERQRARDGDATQPIATGRR